MSKSFKEQLAAAQTKLVALQTKIVELTALAANEFDYSLIQPGAIIVGVFGRGEKRREVQGQVLARRAPERGDELVRVSVGEGFDAEILSLLLSNITRVVRTADGVEVAFVETSAPTDIPADQPEVDPLQGVTG